MGEESPIMIMDRQSMMGNGIMGTGIILAVFMMKTAKFFIGEHFF